jgi:hypothetical protein
MKSEQFLVCAEALADVLRSARGGILLPALVLLDVGQRSVLVEDGGRLVAILVGLAVVVAARDLRVGGGVHRVGGAVVGGPAFTVAGARVLVRDVAVVRCRAVASAGALALAAVTETTVVAVTASSASHWDTSSLRIAARIG